MAKRSGHAESRGLEGRGERPTLGGLGPPNRHRMTSRDINQRHLPVAPRRAGAFRFPVLQGKGMSIDPS